VPTSHIPCITTTEVIAVLAKVNSCALVGLDGTLVEVEVDAAKGKPIQPLVGLPSIADKETK
jgi:magnesium chelatase family protein